MKMTITIDMNNVAFFDTTTNTHDWTDEACRILRELSLYVYREDLAGHPSFFISSFQSNRTPTP